MWFVDFGLTWLLFGTPKTLLLHVWDWAVDEENIMQKWVQSIIITPNTGIFYMLYRYAQTYVIFVFAQKPFTQKNVQYVILHVFGQFDSLLDFLWTNSQIPITEIQTKKKSCT